MLLPQSRLNVAAESDRGIALAITICEFCVTGSALAAATIGFTCEWFPRLDAKIRWLQPLHIAESAP